MRSASCALFTPQLAQRLHQPHVCSSVLERRATHFVTVEDFVTQRIGLELDTSLALGGALQVQSVWSSVVIRGHQRSSGVISSHQQSSVALTCKFSPCVRPRVHTHR